MSKKFRADEPVKTLKGTGRITTVRSGGKVTSFGVTLDETGEEIILKGKEIYKLREALPEGAEVEDIVVEKDVDNEDETNEDNDNA